MKQRRPRLTVRPPRKTTESHSRPDSDDCHSLDRMPSLGPPVSDFTDWMRVLDRAGVRWKGRALIFGDT
eukprot:2260269-Rhodomonas_salina.1